MRKSKRFYNRPKKIISLILVMLIIYININTLTVVLAKSNETDTNNIMQTQEENIIRVADKSTVDDYKKIINTEGGRYNGRVWTDKSVYANNGNGQVTLDNKFNIEYDDDFLTVFSALGSSQAVEKMVAADVSIIMDVSGSMGFDIVDGLDHEDEETRIAHSRIKATVSAINKTIETLMEMNEKNRVCIVTYGGTVCTLMELGHYTKADNNGEYITVEDFMSYNEKNFDISGSCAYTLRVKAIKDGKDYEKSIRNNYTDGIPESKIESVDAWIGYHTNMQAGIYYGFEELYNNMESNSTHIPTAIIITDGGSNYALKNSNESITGDEWYNVPIATSLGNYSTGYKKYRTETNEMSTGGKETILDILMTASYMKVKVQKKYEEQFSKADISKYQDEINFKIHTVSVDTKSMIDTETTQWQVPRIYATLDPKNYFRQDVSELSWEFKQEVAEAYELWQQWKESPTGISSTFTDSDKEEINFKINKLNEDNEITNEDIIKNIFYNDSFRDLSSDDVALALDEIITSTAFNPIGESGNDINETDALSYIDPIGKYMEIKEVKKLLLFGQEYNIIKDGEPIIENVDGNDVSKQYYKAVASNNKDTEIINVSYENQPKFKLSDIKIWKEISNDTEEKLHITIPSNAIPIYLTKIKLDELNNVEEYKTNANTDYALPIRVLYTVGISNNIMNQNDKGVDLTKVSTKYFNENKEEEKNKLYTYFYSNYYDREKNNKEADEKYGDAVITFTPSANNRFYIFQKNLTIYKNSNGGDNQGEGELITTGGKVLLSDPVTDLEQIDPNATYYFAIDYYVPEHRSDGLAGRYVQYATSHKGKEFFGAQGESYLTYYSTEKNQEVDNKGEDVVVSTKRGTNIIGNLQYLSNKKESNVTNTAELYYAPSYGNIDKLGIYSIVSYLGNNGRLAIPIKLGSVTLKKVDEKANMLEGATFGLYAKENIELNGYVYYKKGEEIERKTTDKDGIIEFENLYLGKYEIKEIKAPVGYNVLDEKISFEVTNEKLEHEFTIENTKKIIEENPPKDDPEQDKTAQDNLIQGNPPKEELNDTLPGELPKTGETTNLILLTAIIDFLSISVVCYKKYKKLT